MPPSLLTHATGELPRERTHRLAHLSQLRRRRREDVDILQPSPKTVDSLQRLDLPAGVRTALETAAVDEVTFVGGCTACGPNAFSHRARADQGRQAVLAWIETAA